MPFAHPHYGNYTNEADRPSITRPTLDTGKGLTKQSHRDETNINYIMAKYQRTGIIDFVSKHQPEYMSVTETDFQTAMNTVQSASEAFADLPSQLRKKFNNDPAEFLEFVHDPANLEEMYDLKLANRPAPPPAPATPAPETPAITTPGDPTP